MTLEIAIILAALCHALYCNKKLNPTMYVFELLRSLCMPNPGA